MGTYVYSLRAKARSADLDGLIPVSVLSMQYAYKPTYAFDPGRQYKMMVGRVESQADRAQDKHLQAAMDEHGTTDVHHYIALGDWENGTQVYKTPKGFLPALWADDRGLHPDAEFVGYLFKVGRKWLISKVCPEHDWNETDAFFGLEPTPTPAYHCKVCGETRRREVAEAA